jgi:hypothetical protein
MLDLGLDQGLLNHYQTPQIRRTVQIFKVELDLGLLKHQTTQSGWTWQNKVDLGVLK